MNCIYFVQNFTKIKFTPKKSQFIETELRVSTEQ